LKQLIQDEQIEQHELLRELALLRDVEGCIEDELRSAVGVEDWDSFEVLVWAALRHPSSAYAPTLEEVLDQHKRDVPNEDLIEVLAELRCESSVDPLKRALYWRPEWDEYHSIAVKAVGALAQIGTASAKSILEGLPSDRPAVVRDWADGKLSSVEFRNA
jgi:hypothetical protein